MSRLDQTRPTVPAILPLVAAWRAEAAVNPESARLLHCFMDDGNTGLQFLAEALAVTRCPAAHALALALVRMSPTQRGKVANLRDV